MLSRSPSLNLIPKVFDAHCHLQMISNRQAIQNFIELNPLNRFGVCGTKLEDWDYVITLNKLYPAQINSGIGVHPYTAHLHDSVDVEAKIRRLLIDDTSLFVGEIGIDKAWITKETNKNEFDLQVIVQIEFS